MNEIRASEKTTPRDQVQSTRTGAVRALRPLYFYMIVAIVFVSDQLSKQWVQAKLINGGPSQQVFGQSMLITLTHNTGGAWGLLPRGNMLFITFAALAVVALMYAYHRMERVELLVGAAFALALGGALGNLTDRLRLGYVVDFFDVRLIHWPIFNIADSAITLGITLLMIHFIIPEKSHCHLEPDTALNSASASQLED